NVEGKNKILGFIFPVISQVNDEILKSDVFRVLSNRLKVEEGVLKSEFQKFARTGRVLLSRIQEKKDAPDSLQYAELFVVVSMFENPGLIDKIRESVHLYHLTSPLLRKLYGFVLEYRQKNEKVKTDDMLEEIKDPKMKELVIKELLSEKYTKHLAKQLNDCIYKLKMNRLERSVKLYNDKIRTLKNFQDVKKVEMVIQRIMNEKKELVAGRNKLIE
ncbi:MAG: hypothetical protein PHF84_12320, partial [bacterium]|nr:hypothetical protein [bacterium]